MSEEVSPFCCRASCLLVSMSCSVAARFRGKLPVLPTASRGLCRVKPQNSQLCRRKAEVGLSKALAYL